ncbi:hypothetical protein BS50DRAFT_572717 [Corynespora cassiicola Philippines]|uniref:Uncharacterized protein n=1 Tax=Corynespora cassiicola Philippines TaxID=1448308 RepID=A0A2T2NQX4_CORCC|nr:hypothetical protein BS50DRAFT_572717 [Corynespora cassiicola Philippines]
MAPPIPTFHLSALESNLQLSPKTGKPLKPKDGGGAIDLSSCALKEMLQYKCDVRRRPDITSTTSSTGADSAAAAKESDGGAEVIARKTRMEEHWVVCAPVRRWYRVCANGVHVETTAWEGWRAEREREAKSGDVGGAAV